MSDAKIAYEENGIAIYRASASGTSPHALAASRLGFEPLPVTEKLQRVFDEGHMHEDAVIAAMEKDGWVVTRRQDTVEVPVSAKVKIRGHLDGVFQQFGHSDAYVGDVKSMSDESFKKWQASRWDGVNYFLKYARQMCIYMHATGLPGMLIAKNRNNGDMSLFMFTLDQLPVTLDQIKMDILRVEAAVKKGELPSSDGCDSFPCPYYYLHDEKADADFDQGETDPIIEALAVTYAHGAQLEAQGKAIKAETRDKLIEAMNGNLKHRTDRFSISISTSTRKSINQKQLEEEHPDIAAQYTKETPVTTVRVKEVGE